MLPDIETLCGGKMKRFVFILLLGIFLSIPLFGQDFSDGSEYFNGLHRKGSQNITLALGAGIPLFILPSDPLDAPRPLDIGANFSLGYQYYVFNRIAVGGSLTGAFNTTIGGRTLFMAPISLRAGYWWGQDSMEFNVGMDLGLNIMRLSGNGVITPFVKAGAAAFIKVSEVWGIGGQVFWWFVPELHAGSNANLTRYGNFLELSLGTVYHF